MIETQERESELKKLNEVNKKKLLDDLAQEENKKEAEILKIQKLRDNERKILNDKPHSILSTSQVPAVDWPSFNDVLQAN